MKAGAVRKVANDYSLEQIDEANRAIARLRAVVANEGQHLKAVANGG